MGTHILQYGCILAGLLKLHPLSHAFAGLWIDGDFSHELSAIYLLAAY
jgi:hypothetical protein